ncbi:MAG TPA: Crp/Fnr family transcriptional regulator [Lachnospiraceae bacterium]|jgi:CRP-like cAMP-binding protein|nr:Crp/Fnr family transcriptional regulator [Lachnospiraceae bacterium]
MDEQGIIEQNRPGNCPYGDHDTSCMDRIRLFRGLPKSSRQELMADVIHRSYKEGHLLIEEETKVRYIIVIRRGRVKICRGDADGEEHILDILHDGQAIWHDLFLKEPVYHYSAVCLTDADCCLFSREKFMQIITREPEMALGLIAMLSTELTEEKEKVMLLSIRDPDTRLAGFLLDRDGKCLNGKISMKLSDIAATISLRPETVSRSLTKLQKAGYIERAGRGELRVTDREGLYTFFHRKDGGSL